MARPRPKSKRQYVPQNDALAIASKLKGAKASLFPRFLEPCLATLRDKAPSGAQWIHEIKYDGYRLQLHRRENNIHFYTRRGHDWTSRFKSLASEAWYLPDFPVVIDGEVVVLTESGASDFGALEAELGAGRSDRFTFFGFDLLHIGSWSLRECAQIDRKMVLAEFLAGHSGAIRYSEHLQGNGEAIFTQACDLGIEGIVSKRADAPYRSGRSPNWTKRTCRQRETFVLAGVAFQRGKFDGVYLGRPEGGELVYAGKVENGFDDGDEKRVRALAERLKARSQPFRRKVKKPKAVWLQPEALIEVEYRALTGEQKVRHPSFVGFREDLEPAKKRRR
jgi:bifunctional non-homologous end joining protein LigD